MAGIEIIETTNRSGGGGGGGSWCDMGWWLLLCRSRVRIYVGEVVGGGEWNGRVILVLVRRVVGSFAFHVQQQWRRYSGWLQG